MKIKVEKPSKDRLLKLEVESWPIWEKEESVFDWYYDAEEICYLLEGEVVVKIEDQVVEFKAGDLVTFSAGLDCVWEIKKTVRKHYTFK
ncbi:cupin [Orenia metallireducens]|uniref:Cupin n=1 Tax=Orenia metallireducens TaxID=1413210 RepID=A0A1C0A7C8_9FIRM|nr:cupin [Orenia metallireducens]